MPRPLHFALPTLVALSLWLPAGSQGASAQSDLGEIRRSEEETRARMESYARALAEVNALAKEAARLNFLAEIRLAKIKAGDYERACDTAEVEADLFAEALASLETMAKEASALCDSRTPGDAEQTRICSARLRTLDAERQGLVSDQAELFKACPEVSR